MHFVRTCTIISILIFSFYNKAYHQKIVKVIEHDIYGELFEIYKEIEIGRVS